MFVLNLNVPKTKWDGAKDLTIYQKFLNMLYNVQIDRRQPQYFISTEIYINTICRQVSSWTHIVHQQRYMTSGKNKLERDSQLVSTN